MQVDFYVPQPQNLLLLLLAWPVAFLAAFLPHCAPMSGGCANVVDLTKNLLLSVSTKTRGTSLQQAARGSIRAAAWLMVRGGACEDAPCVARRSACWFRMFASLNSSTSAARAWTQCRWMHAGTCFPGWTWTQTANVVSLPILHPSLSRRRLTLADAVGRYVRHARSLLAIACASPAALRASAPQAKSFIVLNLGSDNLDTDCFLCRMKRDPRAPARRLVCVRLNKHRVWTRKWSSSLTRTRPLGPFLRCCGRSLGGIRRPALAPWKYAGVQARK